MSGLIEESVIKPAEQQKELVESQMCKTRLQHLVIAVWEYTTEKNLTREEFEKHIFRYMAGFAAEKRFIYR